MHTHLSGVEFHVHCVGLGCHVVIGVGRLVVRFHHAYVIPSFFHVVARLYLVVVNSNCSHNYCLLQIAKTGHLRCCLYRGKASWNLKPCGEEHADHADPVASLLSSVEGHERSVRVRVRPSKKFGNYCCFHFGLVVTCTRSLSACTSSINLCSWLVEQAVRKQRINRFESTLSSRSTSQPCVGRLPETAASFRPLVSAKAHRARSILSTWHSRPLL